MMDVELFTINKRIDCTDEYLCSDNIVQKLETLGLKTKAKATEGYIVHGYVSIDHGFGHFEDSTKIIIGNDRIKKTIPYKKYISTDKIERDHSITIGIYKSTEQPNEKHKTTLKKPSKIPTEKECMDLLK